VGLPDLFAKRTFAEETELVTQGALSFRDPPQMRLETAQPDGFLLVRRPDDIAGLPLPWSQAHAHDEMILEIKMPGDHLDIPALERALLRRHARQVQRVEALKPPWMGQEPLWLVAPHVPEVLPKIRDVQPIGPGCYQVGPSAFPCLWIASNELPLNEALIPFLIARSGRAQVEFFRWVRDKRPATWCMAMLEYNVMPKGFEEWDEEKLQSWFPPTDDPERLENRRRAMRFALKTYPDFREALMEELRREIREEGILLEARRSLRRVLSRRGLVLSPEEDARIEVCTDTTVLERWHDQAITAATTEEALR
jgi:hypothetical protein